jgi:arginase
MIGAMRVMNDGPRRLAVLGVPTSLGGHLAGMEETPAGLRALGLVERLADAAADGGGGLDDAGDLRIEPGFRADPDPRAKNRNLIAEFLPRERARVAELVAEGARLLILGGDCTAHAGAIAGLRAAQPDRRLAIAWFDAHGDFNTPDTTPSGNVWGMPFAMLCGRGDPDLVTACGGPAVDEADAALLGGQILDEQESRMLAASPIAHFGAGMLGGEAGRSALEGWARAVGRRVDGLYVAFDADCLDASGGWALTMPETGGLSLASAIAAIRILADAIPVVGFGATAITLANGNGRKTAEAIGDLAAAAFGLDLGAGRDRA